MKKLIFLLGILALLLNVFVCGCSENICPTCPEIPTIEDCYDHPDQKPNSFHISGNETN